MEYSEILPLLERAYNDPLIRVFFWIMLCFFVADIIFSKDLKATIISIGVLGTFAGIFLGLYYFDTSKITESVPKLLEGLKLAFATSILGMFFSIILTVKDFIFQKNLQENSTESLLKSILSEEKKANQFTKDRILYFMAESNKNINSHFNIINKSVKEILNVLSKGAKEEIITALENVISDFNKNLTEQFGDNFKQLNKSVKNMIVWQETYKVTIEQAEKNLQVILTTLEMNAEHSIKLITNFEKISKTSQDLSSIIQTNENQIKNLETHLNSLKKIGDKAQLIVSSIDDFSNKIQNSLSGQSKGLERLNDSLIKQLETSLGKLNEALTGLTNKFRNDYEGYLKEFAQLLKQLPPHK